MSGGDVSGGAGIVRAIYPALALGVVLSGCAAMEPVEVSEPQPVTEVLAPQPPVPPVPPDEPRRLVSDVEQLLTYFGQLRRLSGPDLVREHDAARQAYGSARSDYNRVRLAMVMTMPNTPFYDEPRALDVLDPLVRNSASPLSGLALLLASQIQERKRLDANAQALQHKLDALKSLERSLIERKR